MTKFIVLVSMEDRSYTRIHRVICGHSEDPRTEMANTFCHSYFDTYYEARDFSLAHAGGSWRKRKYRRKMTNHKVKEV